MTLKKKRKAKGRKPIEIDPQVILKQVKEQLAEVKILRARDGLRRLFRLEPELDRVRSVKVTQAAICLAISEGKMDRAKRLFFQLQD